MKIEIYLVENIDNNPNKVYIGKTKLSKRREKNHKDRFGKQILFSVIDEMDTDIKQEWKDLESYWIEQFKQWGFELVNKNKGGGGPETHTNSVRQKLREVNLGNTFRRGKSQTEEAKRKISEARKGLKLTQQTKQKMSLAHKGIPNKVVTCPHCNTTGGINVMVRWHFNNCKLI